MRCIELYKEQMELEEGNNTDIDLKLPGFLDAYYDLFTKFNGTGGDRVANIHENFINLCIFRYLPMACSEFHLDTSTD